MLDDFPVFVPEGAEEQGEGEGAGEGHAEAFHVLAKRPLFGIAVEGCPAPGQHGLVGRGRTTREQEADLLRGGESEALHHGMGGGRGRAGPLSKTQGRRSLKVHALAGAHPGQGHGAEFVGALKGGSRAVEGARNSHQEHALGLPLGTQLGRARRGGDRAKATQANPGRPTRETALVLEAAQFEFGGNEQQGGAVVGGRHRWWGHRHKESAAGEFRGPWASLQGKLTRRVELL